MTTPIQLAHINIQRINCVIFNTDSRARTAQSRNRLLNQLTTRARLAGLAVSKSVLAYREGGRIKLFGDRDLVEFLSRRQLPRWTHTI